VTLASTSFGFVSVDSLFEAPPHGGTPEAPASPEAQGKLDVTPDSSFVRRKSQGSRHNNREHALGILVGLRPAGRLNHNAAEASQLRCGSLFCDIRRAYVN
jgi:hypothetical protein